MYYDHNKSILFFKYNINICDIYLSHHIYPYIYNSIPKLFILNLVIGNNFATFFFAKTFVRVC